MPDLEVESDHLRSIVTGSAIAMDFLGSGMELSKSDRWLSEVRLYSRTPSRLRWPVRSMTSCSSTLA